MRDIKIVRAIHESSRTDTGGWEIGREENEKKYNKNYLIKNKKIIFSNDLKYLKDIKIVGAIHESSRTDTGSWEIGREENEKKYNKNYLIKNRKLFLAMI